MPHYEWRTPAYVNDDELTGLEEHLDHEAGAAAGDPRRCPRHPNVQTSSPDGMFDGLCGACEFEHDLAAEEDEEWAASHERLDADVKEQP